MTRTLSTTLLTFLVAFPLVAARTPQPAIEKPAPPPDLNAPPPAAEHRPDGLVTRLLTAAGSGEHPGDRDYVHIRYAVWSAPSGNVVDFTRGGLVTFVGLDKLLPGMRETFELMAPGERRRAWIPPSLGGGKIPDGESLVVDAELVDVVHPPSAPADVAAPAGEARLTRSGLAYKVLRPGTGTVHPTRRDTVIVHYTGWTTEGQMFDSSVLRDEPAAFPLLSVIPGWTEGLQLMTVGEKTRFWIPSSLAYKNEPGKPQGMLVFDIELLGIK